MEAAAAKKGAGAPGTGAEDQSMEEILQSIRSIIADGDDNTKAAAPPDAANTAANGSDILELTEVVKDDGTVASIKPNGAAAEVAKAPVVESVKSPPPPADVLSTIDAALAVDTPPAATAMPVASSPPADSLLSAQAAQAAASSFKKLKVEEPLPPLVTTPSPEFRSGTTVEDMVAQMLRPMIKEWLDSNLPAIVDRIVEREVRKLSRQ